MDLSKKILVVDDDDLVANMYIRALKLKGFETKIVKNGEEALSVALEYKPDLIILDAMMPEISGFDVLDILKNTMQTIDTPVIMLTALTGIDDIEKAKSRGADEFLEKSSTDIDTIISHVTKLLS